MAALDWDIHGMTRVLTLLELQGLAASMYALSRVDEFEQFHQHRAFYQERAAQYAAYVRQRLGVIDTER